MIATITERGVGLGEGQCHADGGCKGDGHLGISLGLERFLKSVLPPPPFHLYNTQGLTNHFGFWGEFTFFMDT